MFITKCYERLNNNEHQAVLSEVPPLATAWNYKWGEQNLGLFGLFACAKAMAGKTKAALEMLGNTLTLVAGDELSHQQELEQFSHGASLLDQLYAKQPHPDTKTLFSAAIAWRLAGEYDQTIERLRTVAVISPRGNKYFERQMLLARTLSIRRQDTDLEEACAVLAELLIAPRSPREEMEVAHSFVNLLGNSAAKASFNTWLPTVRPKVQLTFISALEKASVFDSDIVNSVANTLHQPDPTILESSPVIIHYLMAACVNAYVTNDRHLFLSFIDGLIDPLSANMSPSMWTHFFAYNTEALKQRIRSSVVDELSRLLEPRTPDALSKAMSLLDTKLLDFVPRAYQGREPGQDLVTHMSSLLDFWATFVEWKDVLDPDICVSAEVKNVSVSAFQCEFVANALNELADQHAQWRVSSKYAGQVSRVRLAIEAKENVLYLNLCFALGCRTLRKDAVAQVLKLRSSLVNWTRVSAHFLPAPISVKWIQGEIVVHISLWNSAICERDRWRWRDFYSDSVLMRRSPKQLKNTYRQIVQDASVKEIREYLFIQMDGAFAEMFRELQKELGGVTHTIKNALRHFPPASPLPWSEPAMKAAAQLRHILTAEHDRDDWHPWFGVYRVVHTAISTWRRQYRNIEFKFRTSPSTIHDMRLHGPEGVFLTAVSDAIHNAIDGVRQLPESDPRKICITIGHDEQGVTIDIENTAPQRTAGSPSGYGIGSQNVRHIVCELYHGSVEEGPVDNKPPFRYACRLVFRKAPQGQSGD